MSGDLTADRRLNEIRAGFEERLDALSTDSDVRAAIAEVLGGGGGGRRPGDVGVARQVGAAPALQHLPSPLKPSVNFSSSITFYDSIPYLNNSTKI